MFKSQHLLTSSQSDQQGRFVCGQFTVADQTFSLCNVYGPNKAREGALFFESLYPVLDPDIPSIVCGDFNTVVDPHLDRRGCNVSSPWAYNWSSTLTTFSLSDVWRWLHPDAVEYTWHRPNSRQASRLDMFWIASFSPSSFGGGHSPLFPLRPLICIFEIFFAWGRSSWSWCLEVEYFPHERPFLYFDDYLFLGIVAGREAVILLPNCLVRCW